ncbi:hypothetical protein BT69DRAFT_610371 [Atractiella rhizophila]|nr:hypothetical protein BT69DRAFT_610371 [Atractiella rhizophila]
MLQFVIKHNLASMRTFNEAINFYLIGVTLKDEELITSASRKAFSFDTRGDSLQSFLSDDLKAWGGSSAHRNALYILFYHIRSRYSSKLEAAIELCYRLTTKKIQFHYKTRKDEALTPRVECDQRAWEKWASTVMSLVQSNRLPYDSFVATIKNEFEETKCHVCDPRLSVIVGETAFSWNERKRTARTCVSLSDLC